MSLLNIEKIPFSSKGSYLAFSKLAGTLYLRSVHGGCEDYGKLLQIELFNDEDELLDYEVCYEAHILTLMHNTLSTKIYFISPDHVRIISTEAKMKISCITKSYDHVNQMSEKNFEFHSYSYETKLSMQVLSGNVSYEFKWARVGNSDATIDLYSNEDTLIDIVIENYSVVPQLIEYSQGDVSQQITERKLAYAVWKNHMLDECNAEYEKEIQVALYILWSSFVQAKELMKRDAIYMSKNVMTNIWSWDHCFNAMAFAEKQPETAYNQFIFFKDFQDESGALPDFVNDKFLSFSCVKPPIHAWAYANMMKKHNFFSQKEMLVEVYDMLSNISRYWEQHRRDEKLGLSYYNHGNDSGWDNATVFRGGGPIVSPDLASYLILHYDVLSDIAKKLQREEYATMWKMKSNIMQKNLITHLYDGEKFHSISLLTREVIESKSLINCMPIILGNKLPSDIMHKLTCKLLSSDYFTDYGFATESIHSEYYVSNGYWRGPIWAPVSLLIIDGLYRSGKKEESLLATKNFLKLVSVGGMAENFDAITGEGLDDTSFTWTASVFLLLLNKSIF